MVKVIIEKDGKVSVLNGEFFFGFVVNEDETDNAYHVDNHIRGVMNPEKFPQILADTTVECLVQMANHDECPGLAAVEMLADYAVRVDEAVKQEILARKDALPRDIVRMLQR